MAPALQYKKVKNVLYVVNAKLKSNIYTKRQTTPKTEYYRPNNRLTRIEIAHMHQTNPFEYIWTTFYLEQNNFLNGGFDR